MEIEMIREIQAEDNAACDEVPFESNIENEAGNIIAGVDFTDSLKALDNIVNTYTPSDSQTIDQHIYSQLD